MDNIDVTSVLNTIAGVLISLLIFAGVSFLFSLISFSVLKRHPKTYIFANLPVIIYPYAYLLVALLAGQGAAVTGQSGIIDFILPIALVLLFLLIHPMCLATVIVNFRAAHMNIIPPDKLANGILLVKLIHVPAFILHFILGSLGVLASVWGLGIIMFAVVIDLLTVIGSGTYTVAAITGLCRQNVINRWTGVLFGILSYIYCVDVAAAIVLKVIVNKKLNSEDEQ